MSTFVDACRKEWGRLGVPEAVANEMASDLEADLAEAAADGVSPEEVLGNGFFDPEAFAASWASARGVVESVPPDRGPNRWRPWLMAAGTAISAMAVLLGMGLLVGRRSASVAVSGVALRKPFMPPLPSVLLNPNRAFLTQMNGAVTLIGLVLLLAGLIGLGVLLWIWKPWSGRRRGGASDRDIGMPSYL
jgi:hypothetical protein